MADEQRVVELVIDASGAEAGVRRAEAAYEHFGDRAAAMVAKVQASFATQTQVLDRTVPGSIDRVGAAYDRLRAKTDPVLSAQLRLESEMTRSLKVIDRAIKLGVTTEQQASAEIMKLRQQQIAELDAVRAAHDQVAIAAKRQSNETAANDNGLSHANRQFIGRDIAFQAQDVVTTAVGGMSPRMIALQQGTQIAGAVQGLSLKETGSVLAGAVTNLLNPIALASIAFTGLFAAGIQYFTKAKDGALSLDDALKKNGDTLERLKGQYGDLAKVSTSITSVAGSSFVLSDARAQQIALAATMRNQIGGFLGDANDTRMGSSVYGANSVGALKSLQGLSGDQMQFAGPVKALIDTVKTGHTPLSAFNDQVESLYANLIKTSENPQALRAAADAVEELADAAFSVDGKFKPFQDAINRLKVDGVSGLAAFADQVNQIGREQGITKLADELLSKADDLVKGAQALENLNRIIQAIDREDTRPGLRDRDTLSGYVARRDATLRQSNERFAADQQMQDARTFAERNAATARVSRADRPANADEGGGADARAARAVQAEVNRQQRELRDSADQRKRSMDESIASQQLELTTIGKTGSEVAALRLQYQLTSQVQLEASKNGISASQQELDLIKQKSAEYGKLVEQASRANLRDDLQFERDQLYRSSGDQQIASRQKSAGLAVDLKSPEADYMRQTSRIEETRTAIKGFLTDFSQQLVSSGGNVGKALGTAIKDAALNALQKIGDKAFDRIATFFTDALLGTGKNGAAGTVGAAASAVNIGAAVLGGAANDNTQKAALTSGTGVAAQAWNFFAQKGLQPHQIAGVLGNINAESSFNANAIGDAGKAFGLFQNHAARGGGQGLLASGVNGQLEHAWTELQGPENKAFQALMKSTDVRGATAAFAGFERPRGWSLANPEGADNFAGRLNGAEAALAKFGSTTNTATTGVGQLGSGLSQLGQGLSSTAFPAAPTPSASGTGGGIFGWLGGLFGGSSQWNAAAAGRLKPGLWASGGYTGPGGVNDPAGVVHRGEVVWSQGDVSRAGGVAVVEAMRLGRRGYAAGGPVDVPPIRSVPANGNAGRSGPTPVDIGVSFDEDNGFRAYVKKTAQQQAMQVSQQGLADYSETQRRGGFLQMQKRATAQKG